MNYELYKHNNIKILQEKLTLGEPILPSVLEICL